MTVKTVLLQPLCIACGIRAAHQRLHTNCSGDVLLSWLLIANGLAVRSMQASSK